MFHPWPKKNVKGAGCGKRPGRNRARIIWAMVVSGPPYDEAKAFDTTPAATARRLKNLQNQALTLNMKLVPV